MQQDELEMDANQAMTRHQCIEAIADLEKIWDIILVGGGATGLGTALDAASRGYSTLLLEQADFAKGTSSRSTKLVHGGVRYLAQGDIGLVKEALFERGVLIRNAAHLVKSQSFIIPNYEWWSGIFYKIGLSIYDLMARNSGFGNARHISKAELIKKLPNIKQNGLYGGVIYYDGQFDDSRLAINLAQTGMEQGAALLNYFKVSRLSKNLEQKIDGVEAIDLETGISYFIKSQTVINATGVFVDELLKMDNPQVKPVVRPSQGVHIVIDKSFLPGESALMIPRTEDKRVLFAIPWHEKILLGTTDTPMEVHTLEPRALKKEIDFILRTATGYLAKPPVRKDILSVFAGLRPLAMPAEGSLKTKEISRSHKLLVSASGLITITGGKWTTYRRMAEDTVDKAISMGKLPSRACRTKNLSIHGNIKMTSADHLSIYGSDRDALLALIDKNAVWGEKLHPQMPYLKAEVIWGVRHEMARNVEDILARRVRVLFLDAAIAIEMAPIVARLIAEELNKDDVWEMNQVAEFISLAREYEIENYN